MRTRVQVSITLALCLTECPAARAADPPVDVGANRQVFVDESLIAEKRGVRLVLHAPTRREIVIANDHPWEKYGVSYMVTFRDGDRFRAWYRCDARPFDQPRLTGTAYAESRDGVHWTKPKLGVVEFAGSKQNNLVWCRSDMKNMAPFKDGNPAAPPDERYKAVIASMGRSGKALLGMVSPDGIRWKLMRDEPILTEPPFDSHNIAFWDPWVGQYVAYTRGVRRDGKLGRGMIARFKKGVRWVRRATSKDFRTWTPLKPIATGGYPMEHFYTNATVPYARAPGVYLMFPSRFADAREPTPGWKYGKGVNDIVLLSSRDGVHFSRTFMEAFVRPGPDPLNWHERSLYMERGILQTGPCELSMYAMENWRADTVHIRRLTLRPDGFVSARAPYGGGELMTRPLRFAGASLRVNFSTSAVGSFRVEVQDARGKPIAPFTLAGCPDVCGDHVDRQVRWKAGADLGRFAGTPVRLRFVMADADLYAFRFCE